jgi:hypothetical protein
VYASAGLPTIGLETQIWVGIDTNHMRVYRVMKEEALLYQVGPTILYIGSETIL